MYFPISLAVALLSSCSIVDSQAIANRTICNPGTPFLTYNNSNIAAITDCLVANSTRQYKGQVDVDPLFQGEVVIPELEAVNEVRFTGVYGYGNGGNDSRPYKPLNVSKISMPDLRNTSILYIDNAANLSSLELPQLEGLFDMWVNLTGPAIDLSFPQLSNAFDIDLFGNINSIDVPRLSQLNRINVTSTGTLNCTDFVARVLNATPPYTASDIQLHTKNDTVACLSPQASIVTARMPTNTSGGIVRGAGWCSTLLSAALVCSVMVAL